jgi:hypothetical protein
MSITLTEAKAIAHYVKILSEASDILDHFGSDISPSLRKAIIHLHQSRNFPAANNEVKQIEKVAWRDIKDHIAQNSSTGKAVALVGAKGAIIVRPSYEEWIGTFVGNDLTVRELNDSSINTMLGQIKSELGKVSGTYVIYYKTPKSRPGKDDFEYKDLPKYEDALVKRLTPMLQKKAIKAKAEINSMLMTMIKNDVSENKITNRLNVKERIIQFLEYPENNIDTGKKVITRALIATFAYLEENVSFGMHGRSLESLMFVLRGTDTMKKIISGDMKTLAVVAYFLERAWLQ